MVESNSIDKIKPINNSVITLGSFDGIHIGHQKLFKCLKLSAKKFKTKSVVITFKPHPKYFFNKTNKLLPKLLSTYEDKNKILQEFGIDYVIIIPFNTEIYHTTAHDFLKNYIVNKFNPIEILIGKNHCFGYQRKGNIDFLKKMSSNFNFSVNEIEPEIYNENLVSSSLIRKKIMNCNIKEAEKLLGRNYKISGKVINGSGRGKHLMFPTANIKPDYEFMLIPGKGVYLVHAIIKHMKFYGMCNIGCRPTFENGKENHIEVHLLNYDLDDLYGKRIIIEFINFIRKENKFPKASDLINQIRKDKKYCIEYIEESKI